MMKNKLSIAFLAPPQGIGGGNRKYSAYYRNLDKTLFDKYYLYLEEERKANLFKKAGSSFDVSPDQLINFLKDKKIQFLFISKSIDKSLMSRILEQCYLLVSVTFIENYLPGEKILNFFICKTDYYRYGLVNKLVNSQVVYDPIEVKKWVQLSKKIKPIYRPFLKKKKFLVGRLARSEPSKWNFLIIKTLMELDKAKNYKYGFIFLGMPYLYRAILRMTLSKKMLEGIVFLPEVSSDIEIARFYKSIDLFWQTSKIGESFGDVIAEAFSFKVPVITDYKNFFRKDGSVNTKLYNAQTELVDHGINGAYCNYPEIIVDFFEKVSLKKLRQMGKLGLKKANKNYDAIHTGKTIARICYDFLLARNEIRRNARFESIAKIPSEKEIKDYPKEYALRLNSEIGLNRISSKSLVYYKLQENLWSIIEFSYLVARKILRRFNLDLETFGKKHYSTTL